VRDPEITITMLGEVLGRDLGALKRSAIEHLTLPELNGDTATDAALETLLDRLCLSLALTKPIGLITWAEREARRVGRAGVSDMFAAAAHAISVAAGEFAVDRTRVLASLDLLTAEVQRAAFGGHEEQKLAPEVDRATDVLMAMLAERDAATSSHSKATAVWARRLATALGQDPEKVEFVELCGLLHDVGKVATPDAILNKPGPLTEDEWSVMRDHSAAGARILSQIPSLRRCAIVVRAHHERFDGKGYPDGLIGSAIPLEARIIAVADSFHAMVTDRPYRNAISPREAMKILEEGKGTQWDPKLIEAFVGQFEHRAPAAMPRMHASL
jgi:putative nucleotidyltransferase with HDIG domain